MKAITYHEESQGTTFDVHDIPRDLLESANNARHHLLEAIAEFDEQLLDDYLHEKPYTSEDLRRALRKGTLQGAINPVLCGSAFKNKGVQRLLDAVVDFLPSPLDKPPIQGQDLQTFEHITRKPKDDGVVLGAGVQDRDRPARRQAHVLPRLLGARADRRHGAERHDRPQGAHRPPAADARQQARGDQGSVTPATSRR